VGAHALPPLLAQQLGPRALLVIALSTKALAKEGRPLAMSAFIPKADI